MAVLQGILFMWLTWERRIFLLCKNAKESRVSHCECWHWSGLFCVGGLRAFENINKVKVPFEIVDRRVGDAAVSFADTQLAKFLSWRASLGLEEMCRDSWRWQEKPLRLCGAKSRGGQWSLISI